ncbi:hypothetical protein EDD11_008187 [Mortierella claussenii]|nr:hypothetical protein EDD11_008187 [Mortierella claussenii]
MVIFYLAQEQAIISASTVIIDRSATSFVKSQLSLVIESSRGVIHRDVQKHPTRETHSPSLPHQHQQQQKSTPKLVSVPISHPNSNTAMLMAQEQSMPPTAGKGSGIISRDGLTISTSRFRASVDHSKPLPAIIMEQPPSPYALLQEKGTPSKPVAHLPTPIPVPAEVQLPMQPLLQQPQIQSQTPQQPQKHQRRRSFIPSGLMTSNLVKFVNGTHSATSSPTASAPTGPGTSLSQTNTPRSPRAPTMISHTLTGSTSRALESQQIKRDEAGVAVPALADGALLSIEQFKWISICCCNEIKGRVVKYRAELSNPSQIPLSLNPGILITPPVSSTQQRKAEKASKTSRFNSSFLPPSISQSVETPQNDSRAILEALLQVLIRSTAEAGPARSSHRPGQQRQHRRDGSMQDSATAFYHGSSLQPQNQSLLSLMGLGGPTGATEGAAESIQARSVNQIPRHSSSFHSLTPSVSSVAPGPNESSTNSSASTLQTQHSSQQQQRQHASSQQNPELPRLRSKKSQSKIALAQANDAVLNPLSLEGLVRVLAYTLSIAPEQWIPWHLYDFFIRPQGRKFKDLVELLPTHSQRILKSILETVEALVDYAVMVTLAALRQHQERQQQQRQYMPMTVTKTKNSASTSAASMMAAWSSGVGIGNGGNEDNSFNATGSSLNTASGTRQQDSHTHLKSRSEILAGINSNKPGVDTSIAILIVALSPGDPPSPTTASTTATTFPSSTDDGADASVLQEMAVRARKRRVIVDSLSCLVFRSRQDISISYYGSEVSLDRDMLLMKQAAEAAVEERSKSKRRYSSAVPTASSAAVGGSGPGSGGGGASAVSGIMRLQASERERESGLKAFENLMFVFEEEYHPHKEQLVISSMNTLSQRKHMHIKASVTQDLVDDNDRLVVDGVVIGPLGSVSLPNSPLHDMTPVQQQLSFGSGSAALPPPPPLPPRQARSLPGPTTSPLSELATVRSSLSLPPWRKNNYMGHPLHALHPHYEGPPQQLGQGQVQTELKKTSNNRSHHNIAESPSESPICAQPGVPTVPAAVAPSSSLLPPTQRSVSSAVPLFTSRQTEKMSRGDLDLSALVAVPATETAVTALETCHTGANSKRQNGSRPNSEPPRPRPKPESVVSSPSASPPPSTVSSGSPVAAAEPLKHSTDSSALEPTPIASSSPLSLPLAVSSNDSNERTVRRCRRMSATLSATWSAWKDHLLVLEEEEYVIADVSDSDEDSIGAVAVGGEVAKGRRPNDLDDSRATLDGENEDIPHRHRQRDDDHVHNIPSNKTATITGDDDNDDDSSATEAPSTMPPLVKRKASRAFGDLQRLAAALEANDPVIGDD